MSRVGKNPVAVPSGVTVSLAQGEIKAKGKLGELAMRLSGDVEVKLEDNKVWVKPVRETKQARMMWGTTRNLVRSMLAGVSQGYSKSLEISGVGYRAAVQGKTLQLQLGFSHDVMFPIPSDIQIKCDKPTSIQISGANKQRVGQVAAEIRAFRKPEPYKGKGIMYLGEKIVRKEGKKK
ncbi:MAG TPA: 50S ribosomal protein L6 [Dongiaceae bacterium]|jgi:large subunit ribosomal protein L6